MECLARTERESWVAEALVKEPVQLADPRQGGLVFLDEVHDGGLVVDWVALMTRIPPCGMEGWISKAPLAGFMQSGWRLIQAPQNQWKIVFFGLRSVG
jgi:hypothetical protein